MEIAYACKFVYRPDHCQVSRGHFYPELYVNFMNDVKEWFQLHLDMIVAKENEAVVLSWVICINSPSNLYYFTRVSRKKSCVCNRFHVCYVKILSFLEGIKKLGKSLKDNLSSTFILLVTDKVFVIDACLVLSCLSEFFYVLFL